MNRDVRVSTKIVMHILIPSLYFTNVTRDRVCVVYALMSGTNINFGVVLKSSMQKVQVHRGHRYSFRDLITTFCRYTGVLEKPLDNRPDICAMPYSVTNIKESNISFSSTMTSQERAHRDDLIMGQMYRLEILCYWTRRCSSTDVELYQMELQYPLNNHAKAVMGIGPEIL